MSMRSPLGLNDITVFPPPTMNPDRAQEVYDPAFRRVIEYVTHSNIAGEVIEFGTYHGYTARVLAEYMYAAKSDKRLILYDSWEGFPKPEGNDAACPEVVGNIWMEGSCKPAIGNADEIIRHFLGMILPGKVETVKGFYHKGMKLPDRAAVVHIDCDLYESTVTVLKALLAKSVIHQGTVILFDDFNNNLASNQYGERRAVRDTDFGFFELEPWFTYGSAGYAFIAQTK